MGSNSNPQVNAMVLCESEDSKTRVNEWSIQRLDLEISARDSGLPELEVLCRDK